MGSTMPKTQRQLSELRMSPESDGPSAGAAAMTIEMLPMTLPRMAGGTSVMIVVMSSGIMMAVPDAWTTRPTSSHAKPGRARRAACPR